MKRVATTSERIKEALKLRGMKQTDLSNASGIDKGSISYYCSGRYEPKQDAIYKMAKALDVSEMWLWGYDCPIERPLEQKNNDELVSLINRLETEKEFRSLVVKLGKLNPNQMQVIKAVMAEFPVE